VARDWLAPGQAPASVRPARARQVCTCFDVDELRILQLLSTTPGSAAERLFQVQGELRCGTRCGSCLPALRSLVAGASPATATPVRADAAAAG
jgi:assimilatory nitrate reductase catalytic subunit